jgi:hypothetical protein
MAAVALVLAGCASKAKPHATAAAGAPGPTNVTFRAFTSTGSLTVPIADVVRGECWTTSIAAPVAGAYRCFQGNKILDPCFAPAHPATPLQVACVATPWSRALMLTVTGTLPKPAAGDTTTRPWAFQLNSGVRCVASTGMVPSVRGVNLGYHCADGGNATLAADGSSTASYATAAGTTLQTMAVTTIWRA